MIGQTYDLVVVGAGAAGMAAAVVAHEQGLRVLVIEKSRFVGGTTSYSGGVIWVPNSRQNREAGVEDSVELALEYLDATLPGLPEREARIRYLERAPEAIAHLEKISLLKFLVRHSNSPDYFPDLPGAQVRGRALTPVNYNGRNLNAAQFGDIRPPLPELCLFGTAMLDGPDLFHFLNARRSASSANHTARFLVRHLRDRLFFRAYGRGARLTGGNAVVARLYKSLIDRGVPILRNTPLVDLVKRGKKVRGAVVRTDGVTRQIAAEHGVILSTGGFPWSEELRSRHIPDVQTGYSAASPDARGDGIEIAMRHGAKLETRNSDGAFWTPVSLGRRRDGTTAHFPHLMADRSKPGLIAVNGDGKRFCNEAENYHDFVRTMVGRSVENPGPHYLICDHSFVRKYPFGMAAPLAAERRRHVRTGYLTRARTLDELCSKTGITAAALKETLGEYNRHAAEGRDPAFGKGSTAYNRYLGDPAHAPNPCLAPIETAPYYAIRIYPGDIGTSMGLSVDLESRVLGFEGLPIDGLYACGNDRNSIMGGLYPSGGITIGPALTFAYLAALHAAGAGAG